MIKYCYYLNLDKRPDRKLFIETELNKSHYLKDIYQRYEAIDGATIHPRTVKDGLLNDKGIDDILMDNISRWGLSLTQGGLGVLLTYLSLFEKIKELNSPVITFEDDIIINDFFDEELPKVINELPENFDLCYLGYGGDKIERDYYSENLSIPTGILTCLPSLIISPNGARKMIDLLKGLDNQIDTALYLRFKELNVYVSNKKLVTIKNHYSTDIQGDKNCKKEYKKQNYIISTIAYGETANKNAVRLAFDLNYFKQKLLVVTDRKDLYTSYENVIAVDYPYEGFSYNNKITCFEEGFKIEDCVVYVDADTRIFYKDHKKSYVNFLRIIPPGFHPSWDWGKITRHDGTFFTSNDIINRVKGYGELAKQLSIELNIPIDEAFHYQEGIIIICKENGKENVFLETWKYLARELDKYEKSMGSHRIGAGEGNLIGLSQVKSKLTLNTVDIANLIGDDLKYNFFGYTLDQYKINFPDRKIVKLTDGILIKKNEYQIKFNEKLIDLSYSIFQIEDNLMVLTFNWNNKKEIEFLDHEFKINGVIHHFQSENSNEFMFPKSNKIEIFHTYDWYGERDWKLIENI